MIKRTLLAMLVGAAFLSGCEMQGHISSASKPLTEFLALHEKFCESNYDSPDALADALMRADNFKPSSNIAGIFETVVDQVSYAVSSEEAGCTTDLKIKAIGADRPYFDFEDLNKALISRGYKAAGERREMRQIGMDERFLQIVEMRYLSPGNTMTILAFPLEREDQYYMTLFAEKFGGSDEHVIPISVKTAEI